MQNRSGVPKKISKDLRILIFAHPRSGSGTLTEVLNCHPKINLLIEPFHTDHVKWHKSHKDYKSRVHTIDDLRRCIHEIHASFNGFKHQSYQLSGGLTEHLLFEEKYKVIFLYRKNLLKSAVSAEIAEQTKIFTVEKKGELGYPEILLPLDISVLKHRIKELEVYISKYLRALESSDVHWLVLTYEALFEVPRVSQIKKVEEVFSFLGLPIPEDKKLGMFSLLDQSRRMNTEDVYRLIPNIREIEETLGNEKTGYLFR